MNGSGRDPSGIDAHLERVHACERDWNGWPLATATPPDERYPLVYPRDTAMILRVLSGLHDLDRFDGKALEATLRGGADFLVAAQRDDGTWGQRYDEKARDASVYPQEDNTAHAITVIAGHVLNHRERDGESPIEDACMDAIERGFRAAEGWLDPRLGLYRSTTSVHESRIEQGFTLWVNGAFAHALERGADAARATGRDERARAWRHARRALLDAIRRHLVHDGRFVRRLTLDEDVDTRPDMTLLSPWLFGFQDLDRDAEARGVRFMEEHLVDPDLGLLCRYPADNEDEGAHMHGGHGPYLSFSGWWTQRAAKSGDLDRARERLERISGYATRDGDLPEHVATMERFSAFMRDEFLTGRDFRKEFDDAILLDGVGWRDVLAEAQRMTAAYHEAVTDAEAAGDDIVRIARPHAWTHAEYAYALALVDARS